MFTNQITPRLLLIGKALLGENLDGTYISIVDQRDILNNATLAELVAAKAVITRWHCTNCMAQLLVDCYLSAKSRQYAVAS